MSYQAVPIQDRIDIDNLFSAYAYTLDDGDADAWIALYTEDGVFGALKSSSLHRPKSSFKAR